MRAALRKKIDLYDILVKIRRFPNNSRYLKLLKNAASIDSLRDFDRFSEAMEPFARQEVPVEYSVYGGESYYYGYYSEFMRYAGVKLPGVPVFPRMEHGVRFGQPKWSFDPNALAYACQGRRRIHEIWDEDPMKPVFAVGPYIHYAREYYSPEKMAEWKKQLGRVLLVFPSHTAENATNKLSEQSFVDIVYEKYAEHFDTVMVCAYWRDTKNSVIEEFRRRGAIPVSAGFRGDWNFIRKLKTIISLSDAVVGDDIGTNIGFCLCMGRPYYLEEMEETRSVDPYFLACKSSFFEAFHSEDLQFTDEQKQLQQELYQSFWGGDEALYSPEDAQYLVKMIMEIYRTANYRIDRVPAVIRDTLDSMQVTEKGYQMLSNAVKYK